MNKNEKLIGTSRALTLMATAFIIVTMIAAFSSVIQMAGGASVARASSDSAIYDNNISSVILIKEEEIENDKF